MNRRIEHLGLVHFFSDLLAMVAAYYTTLLVRFDRTWGDAVFTWINRTFDIRESGVVGPSFETFYIISAPRIILFLTVTLTVLYALRDLYAERRFILRRPVAWNVLVCNVMALAFFYMYFYLRRNLFHPRSMFLTILFLNTVYCVVFRALTDRLLMAARRRWGWDVTRVVLLGRNRAADRIATMIAEMPSGSLCLAAQEDTRVDEPPDALRERVRAAAARHQARMLVLAEPGYSIGQIMQLLELADDLNLEVKVLSPELDVLLTRAHIDGDMVLGIPLVHFAAPSRSHFTRALKTVVYRVASVLLLAGLAPFMVLMAALVRLTSSGPALFQQERIGVNRKVFRMYKFRTMFLLADERIKEIEELNESGRGLFKMRKDPRVTPVGRVLRRYSLDELPQLLNVARGEMTLVGPRPLPRRDYENYYEDWHYGRHNGLPGLTCLWQVSGRSDLDFHTMCILDIYYLRNQDWVLDLRILLRTVRVVLFATGAY